MFTACIISVLIQRAGTARGRNKMAVKCSTGVEANKMRHPLAITHVNTDRESAAISREWYEDIDNKTSHTAVVHRPEDVKT
jgi:hypothetical protein